jgi:Tfp pilus assembly protein PilV
MKQSKKMRENALIRIQKKSSGAMFSVEALMMISVLILAVITLGFTSSSPSNNTKNIEIANQSEKAIMLYFNLPQTNSNPDSNIQYCGQIESFNTDSKQLSEKTKCGWAQ